tara:strand:- start:34922 stop:35809 length:888 start_codon:yes stop_codon:yes gene_type:complete
MAEEDKNNKLKFGAYVRLSQKMYDLSKDETETSILNQRKDLERYVKMYGKGADLIEVYDRDKYITGADKDRPDFNRMIMDATVHKKINAIVFKNLDRFARNASLQKDTLEMLHLKDVRVFSLEDGEIKQEDSLVVGIKGVVNEELIQKMRRDTRKLHKRKMEEGLPFSPPPFGFRSCVKGREKTWQLDNRKAEIVREMFKLILEGNTQNAIAQKFKMYSGTVYNILHNKSYIGILTYKEKFYDSSKNLIKTEVLEYKAKIPQLISEELFFKVQKKIKEKKPPIFVRKILEKRGLV